MKKPIRKNVRSSCDDHIAFRLPWLLPRGESSWAERPSPLANSLAQSWHMEKSCDHWASQDFPGFVAPQLLQQTHFVQTWQENDRCAKSTHVWKKSVS